MTKVNVSAMRKDYNIAELKKEDLDPNPLKQFQEWFKEAVESQEIEANAFVLSTIGIDGVPEGRVVLMKSYADDGFTFYTNYESSKAKQLEENPVAAMTFFWKNKERQVRVKGRVSKVEAEVSNEYFSERPEGSRVGAWASPQSKEIPNREYLIKKVELIKKRFDDVKEMPRPDFWGGYKIEPFEFEFWQGRPSRLHDRIVYNRVNDSWMIKRLAP